MRSAVASSGCRTTQACTTTTPASRRSRATPATTRSPTSADPSSCCRASARTRPGTTTCPPYATTRDSSRRFAERPRDARGGVEAAAGESVGGLLDRDLEPGDDAGIAPLCDEVGVGIAGRHPCVSVFGVGDHVREAPGTDREKLDGLIGRVAERVQPGPSLRAEDEVPRGQRLLAVLVPE